MTPEALRGKIAAPVRDIEQYSIAGLTALVARPGACKTT